MISHKQVRARLDYDPETGVFTWRSLYHKSRVGAVAGNRHNNGYLRICLEDREYLAHRLAWFWMTGQWPEASIDHRNGIKDDNRWANLRQATRSQQACNIGLIKSSTSGLKGVSWQRHAEKWRASIQVAGRSFHLGYFTDKNEAHAAYTQAATTHFGEFACVGDRGAVSSPV